MSVLMSPGPVAQHRFGALKEHPLFSYFLFTFALSWAGMLGAVLLTPGGLSATPEQVQQSLGLAIVGMLLGPLVAGLGMTWVMDGRAGLHALRLRLTRARVGLRWYAVAVLVAPVTIGGSLLVMSLVSEEFLPRIVTAEDKVPLLLMGLFTGLAVGTCEELGWTGFATPRMRLRWSVLGTGVILGVGWSAWHLLQGYYSSGVTSHEVSLAIWAPLELLACLVGQLVAYRVLMVWVHENTGGSVLLAIVMHASLAGSTIVLFPPLSVVTNMVGGFVAAAAMWAVVAVVGVAHHRRLPAGQDDAGGIEPA